ncbi:Maltose O-acetyltransferase [Allocatenococcus thiocycli]|uniref:sugar O-acetyltransferase n=1 Tax=Vibrio natriegens TaxID=691 RepID=UPI001F8FC879|nr:sugar O-acetyltransferase [Vibrio natriegens]CAH0526360.1 Maltose O-acetyltransferase [Catenococcus thiocycli]
MSEFQKMLSGELYNPSDNNLSLMRARARKLIDKFNHSSFEEEESRLKLLTSLLGKAGDNISIHQNFYCDYGCNIYVGSNFFANYDCVILDCAEVHFGDNCLLGPQVGIYTATHPLDPIERASGLESAKPIHIGNDCWIGGHATINPGVTLGNNVVVASGSVVTKSFGDNLVIGGNPARIIRELQCSSVTTPEAKEAK